MRVLLCSTDGLSWSAAVDRDAWLQLGPCDLASALAQLLEQFGNRAGTLRLSIAVPSSWCLCGRIASTNLPRRGREEALIYRLEEELPAAAEDVVAAFIEHDQEALGIALLAERVRPAIEMLPAGARIQRIAPAALWAGDMLLQACARSPIQV
jgi:hypothetical protein